MPDARTDLLQGTLDLLVLQTLTLGPLHGWAISKRIGQLSADVLQVNQGSLYPALYRLEDQGLIASAMGRSPEGRAIKLYRLLRPGRARLLHEVRHWRLFASAINAVIQAT